MKKIYCLLALAILCGASSAMAQQKAKLSPFTKIYLAKAEKVSARDKAVPGYVYRTLNGQLYISALLKVNSQLNETALSNTGAKIGTKAGNIWSVQIPVQQVQNFAQLSGIEYLQLDEPASPNIDRSRIVTRVDSVHAGILLPQPYTGKDVVVGIVDAGFDYGHPTFFGHSGTGYRVKKVWEQKTNGTPPAGFAFGDELTDSTAMWQRGTDRYLSSHGTHVAGIAAGSGVGSNAANTKFRGMAYESDIVMVGMTPDQSQFLSTGATDMLDGISYVFDHAQNQGKPAVVNMSWGNGGIGPHDGTSLLSQAIDNITGPGKIFVNSAGNSGSQNLHHQKTFSAADTVLHTFFEFNQYNPEKKSWIDIWGDSAKTFCVNITLYNGNTAVSSTGYICLDDQLHQVTLIGSNNDTLFANISTSASEYNNKPRILLDFESLVPDDINISVKGTDGNVHVYTGYVLGTSGYFGSFTNGGKSWATAGNTQISISDLATTKSAITVGAFMSRKTYTDINGQSWTYAGNQGAIAAFSSHGPTADGRSKPDITGPGIAVGSSVSSFDSVFMSTGVSYNSVVNAYNNPADGKNYHYAMLAGTSMSSPAVAGIIALMLEANPALTPDQVKSIIAETAIKDNFTTQNPSPNTWGAGKINAYGALKRVLQLTGTHMQAQQSLGAIVFPNPSSGQFSLGLQSPKNDVLQVEILDVLGRVITSENWQVSNGYNTREFSISNAGKGIYFARISSGSGSYSVSKLVVE